MSPTKIRLGQTVRPKGIRLGPLATTRGALFCTLEQPFDSKASKQNYRPNPVANRPRDFFVSPEKVDFEGVHVA